MQRKLIYGSFYELNLTVVQKFARYVIAYIFRLEISPKLMPVLSNLVKC